ncbi:MAG: hypothetical protein R6V05_07875 [Candidatus Brocadiia bacterium]|jgi:hypothetical protein
MATDPAQLARKLAAIQNRLRRELFEELQDHEQELDSVFDPYSYNPLAHELRDKFLTRLYLLHGVIQQLAHYSQGQKRHTTRVVSVAAEDRPKLVRLVNRKLQKLNGAKVLDVKFMPGGEEGWSALITYELNPLTAQPGETTARM